jgi:hypothetical protein
MRGLSGVISNFCPHDLNDQPGSLLRKGLPQSSFCSIGLCFPAKGRR